MAAGSLTLPITLPYSLCNVKCKKMTLNHSLVSKKYVSQILKKTLTKQHNTTSICLTALLQSVLIFKFIHSCFLLYLPCYFYLLFFCFFFLYSRVDYLLTDTSVKRTPRVGACHSLLPLQPTVTFKTGIKSPS